MGRQQHVPRGKTRQMLLAVVGRELGRGLQSWKKWKRDRYAQAKENLVQVGAQWLQMHEHVAAGDRVQGRVGFNQHA